MAALISKLLSRAADLLWPRVCAVKGCPRMSDRSGRHLCSTCFASLPFYEAGGACSVCGAPVMAEARHSFVCETCLLDSPAFEFARSAVFYREPVGQIIQDFKYRRATWLCDDLVDLLEGAVRAKLAFGEIDVVMPVPLHPTRLRSRGYNQSALLSRSLARRINRREDEKSLVRTRDTEHQARLSGDERRKNLQAAFSVADPGLVRGRTVLLVDDIMTSGTTLSECARPLLAAGATRVWCATVARAALASAAGR